MPKRAMFLKNLIIIIIIIIILTKETQDNTKEMNLLHRLIYCFCLGMSVWHAVDWDGISHHQSEMSGALTIFTAPSCSTIDGSVHTHHTL